MKTAVFTENTLRHLGPLSLSLASILFISFGLTAAVPAASAQTSHPKLLLTSKPSTPTVPKAPEPAPTAAAPPGSALYVAKRGDSIPLVAHHYLSQTSYLTSSELSEAIRGANGDFRGTFLKAGQPVIIPGLLPMPIVEKSIPVQRDFEVRAVYLTGLMAASDHGIRIIRHWREVGGNSVVFDIKDSDGSVTIPFDHPLLGFRQHGPVPFWLNHLDPEVRTWLADHAIEGVPVLPATAVLDGPRPVGSTSVIEPEEITDTAVDLAQIGRDQIRRPVRARAPDDHLEPGHRRELYATVLE